MFASTDELLVLPSVTEQNDAEEEFCPVNQRVNFS
jgi:hypothetical protein